MPRKTIPATYFIITGLTGMALTFSFFGWFREFGLLFGFQMTSVVITLTSWFLIAAGAFHISGKLSSKFVKPLQAVIVLLSAAAIFILLQSFLFHGLTLLCNKIIDYQVPGSFTSAVLHFIMSLLFFLIPAGLMAASFPLYITPYIRNLSQSGMYVSVTIISVSLGIIFSLLSIPVLISFSGIKSLYIVAAFLLFLICLTLTLLNRKTESGNISLATFNVYERTKTAIRFKKKKAVPDVNTKLTRAMLYGFVFQTMIFSGMVITGIRILLNFNLSDAFLFFALTFSVILVSISAGAFLYNKIAERPGNKYMTLATMQIISGLTALLSYIAVSYLGKVLFDSANLAGSSSGLIVRELMLFSMLLSLPALLYGMSFPLAGKIYPKRIQQMGNTYGQLGKLAFLSITLAVIVTPFVIIPLTGLHPGYFFLSLMMLFSGIYLVSRDSRLIRLFRLGYASTAVLLFIIIAGMFRVFKDTGIRQYEFRKVEGSSATFSVMKESDLSLSVYMNNDFYTGTGIKSMAGQVFSASLPKIINKNIQSALVIGFGTGITTRIIDEYGTADIQIAEIFPEMIRLSSDVFADYNNDVMTSSRVNISVQDGRSFLLRSKKKFDLITTGNDGVCLMPGLNTSEFAEICYNHLSKTGIVCMGIPFNQIADHEFKSICKSWQKVFKHTCLWYASSNLLILIASKEEIKIDYCNLRRDFASINISRLSDSLHLQSPQALMAHLFMNESQMEKMTLNVKENRDSKPDFVYNLINHPDTTILQSVVPDRPAHEEILVFSDSCLSDENAVRDQITRINELLRQNAALSFSNLKKHAIDFSEPKD